MNIAFWPSFSGALLIACVHLFVGRMKSLRRADGLMLPASTGIAIAYVFMDVLPHLASKQAILMAEYEGVFFNFAAHHTYLLALLGFMVFLGVELNLQRQQQLATDKGWTTQLAVVAASLCFYSFLIGYMLAEQPAHRVEPALLFAIAMSAHFAGLNFLHWERAPFLYDGPFRIVYAASILVGWFAGYASDISEPVFAMTFSYLAGGIIGAAVVSELPRVKQTRNFVVFCVGAIGFTVLILLFEAARSQ
jgi:hypothetical protein